MKAPLLHRAGGDLTLSGFVASLVAAVVLVSGAYWLWAQERRAQDWIAHTHQAMAVIAATRADLIDMQNGQRGFVITGREADLLPYAIARDAVDGELRELAELTRDNPTQQANLAALEDAFNARLESSEAVIQARRKSGFEGARAFIDLGLPGQHMQRLRTALGQLEQEEKRLLAQRLAVHEQRLTAFWIGSFALLAGLAAGLILLYLQVRRKRELQQLLLRKEQQFHAMADSVTEYAILLLDAKGHVRTWNPGAERIKGYTEAEIVGRHLSCFYTEEDVRADRPARSLERAANEGVCTDEGWRVRKDGSRFWASVAITPLVDAGGHVTGYCKITRDLTDRKHAEEALLHEMQERTRMGEQLQQLNAGLEAAIEARTAELRQSNAELLAAKEGLQQLSSRLITAQEEERRHIARELHDETGQALTLIRLRLAELAATVKGADEHVADCTQQVDRAIAHIRGLSLRLRPPMLDDLGLPDALEWLLEQQSQAAGWDGSIDLSQLDGELSQSIETACFRICQEALTNAARSARATEVRVGLRVASGTCELTVTDNGVGFDLERYRSPEERKKHFGLVSMTERATLAGGRLQVDTAPGEGTRIRAVFPTGQ